MRKPWETVKLKILLGYLFVIGISAFMIWLIYSEFFVYAENRSKLNSLNDKIIYFNSALTNLYQAETLERTFSQTGNQGHYVNYRNLMDMVIGQFDSLSKLTVSSTEKKHADSIVILLKEKRRNSGIVISRKMENPEDLIERALSEFSINRDSLNSMLDIQKTVTTRSESIYVEQKKRKFFERLAYAFNPKEESDSVLQISKQKVIENDTSQKAFNPADSVIRFLTAVMSDIKKENELNQRQKARKENILLAHDRIITFQLRQMLSHFEKEIIVSSLGEISALQEKIRQTTGYLIILALISLAVVIIFLVLILEDITKSKQYRLELEKSKAYSDSLLRSKEQFMLSITHDIKSPIASITGYARLINESADRLQKETYLAAINKSCEHILKLINDLFDFTKLETGKLRIENVPFNMHTLIGDIKAVFYPIASSGKLKFEVINEILPERDYLSDPSRIKQILSNLLSNAFKYTDKGGVTLRVYMERSDKEQDIVLFDVTDTGIGISQENIRIIFNEFSQIPIKEREKYEGVGLGLNIAQRLADLLHGSIMVKSEPGNGSCFTVRLPLNRSELREANLVESVSSADERRILILDDDEIFLNFIGETLQRSGIKVIRCNSPASAIQALSKHKVHLIITDIQIPGMSGIDFLSYIQRKTGRLIPVIVMSGQDSVKPEDFPDLHISACLVKPFLPDELNAGIEKAFKPALSSVKLKRNDNNSKAYPAGDTEKIQYSLSQIRQFAVDDPESIQRILTSFAESSYQNLGLFQQYLHDRDRERLAELSHKMLAMFRQLHADQIVNLLTAIESNTIESFEEWNAVANTACQKISRFIDVFCEEQGISVLFR